jgi:hypothetical protein
MVVRAGLRVRMDVDDAGPALPRPRPGGIDRRRAIHARSLRRVGVGLIALDHPHASELPVNRSSRRRRAITHDLSAVFTKA